MIPGPFHLPSTHKILILLESNQVIISSLPQTITMAFLSTTISMGVIWLPIHHHHQVRVGASRCQDPASPVTSPIAPAENTKKDPISVEELSDAGSDGKKIGGVCFGLKKTIYG